MAGSGDLDGAEGGTDSGARDAQTPEQVESKLQSYSRLAQAEFWTLESWRSGSNDIPSPLELPARIWLIHTFRLPKHSGGDSNGEVASEIAEVPCVVFLLADGRVGLVRLPTEDEDWGRPAFCDLVGFDGGWHRAVQFHVLDQSMSRSRVIVLAVRQFPEDAEQDGPKLRAYQFAAALGEGGSVLLVPTVDASEKGKAKAVPLGVLESHDLEFAVDSVGTTGPLWPALAHRKGLEPKLHAAERMLGAAVLSVDQRRWEIIITSNDKIRLVRKTADGIVTHVESTVPHRPARLLVLRDDKVGTRGLLLRFSRGMYQLRSEVRLGTLYWEVDLPQADHLDPVGGKYASVFVHAHSEGKSGRIGLMVVADNNQQRAQVLKALAGVFRKHVADESECERLAGARAEEDEGVGEPLYLMPWLDWGRHRTECPSGFLPYLQRISQGQLAARAGRLVRRALCRNDPSVPSWFWDVLLKVYDGADHAFRRMVDSAWASLPHPVPTEALELRSRAERSTNRVLRDAGAPLIDRWQARLHLQSELFVFERPLALEMRTDRAEGPGEAGGQIVDEGRLEGIAVGPDGVVWVRTHRSVGFVSKQDPVGRLVTYTPAMVPRFVRSAAGGVWMGGEGGLLGRLSRLEKEDGKERVAWNDGSLGGEPLLTLTEGGRGVGSINALAAGERRCFATEVLPPAGCEGPNRSNRNSPLPVPGVGTISAGRGRPSERVLVVGSQDRGEVDLLEWQEGVDVKGRTHPLGHWQVRRRFETREPVFVVRFLAGDDGFGRAPLVLAACESGLVWAWDADTGVLRWMYRLRGPARELRIREETGGFGGVLLLLVVPKYELVVLDSHGVRRWRWRDVRVRDADWTADGIVVGVRPLGLLYFVRSSAFDPSGFAHFSAEDNRWGRQVDEQLRGKTNGSWPPGTGEFRQLHDWRAGPPAGFTWADAQGLGRAARARVAELWVAAVCSGKEPGDSGFLSALRFRDLAIIARGFQVQARSGRRLPVHAWHQTWDACVERAVSRAPGDDSADAREGAVAGLLACMPLGVGLVIEDLFGRLTKASSAEGAVWTDWTATMAAWNWWRALSPTTDAGVRVWSEADRLPLAVVKRLHLVVGRATLGGNTVPTAEVDALGNDLRWPARFLHRLGGVEAERAAALAGGWPTLGEETDEGAANPCGVSGLLCRLYRIAFEAQWNDSHVWSEFTCLLPDLRRVGPVVLGSFGWLITVAETLPPPAVILSTWRLREQADWIRSLLSRAIPDEVPPHGSFVKVSFEWAKQIQSRVHRAAQARLVALSGLSRFRPSWAGFADGGILLRLDPEGEGRMDGVRLGLELMWEDDGFATTAPLAKAQSDTEKSTVDLHFITLHGNDPSVTIRVPFPGERSDWSTLAKFRLITQVSNRMGVVDQCVWSISQPGVRHISPGFSWVLAGLPTHTGLAGRLVARIQRLGAAGALLVPDDHCGGKLVGLLAQTLDAELFDLEEELSRSGASLGAVDGLVNSLIEQQGATGSRWRLWFNCGTLVAKLHPPGFEYLREKIRTIEHLVLVMPSDLALQVPTLFAGKVDPLALVRGRDGEVLGHDLVQLLGQTRPEVANPARRLPYSPPELVQEWTRCGGDLRALVDIGRGRTDAALHAASLDLRFLPPVDRNRLVAWAVHTPGQKLEADPKDWDLWTRWHFVEGDSLRPIYRMAAERLRTGGDAKQRAEQLLGPGGWWSGLSLETLAQADEAVLLQLGGPERVSALRGVGRLYAGTATAQDKWEVVRLLSGGRGRRWASSKDVYAWGADVSRAWAGVGGPPEDLYRFPIEGDGGDLAIPFLVTGYEGLAGDDLGSAPWPEGVEVAVLRVGPSVQNTQPWVRNLAFDELRRMLQAEAPERLFAATLRAGRDLLSLSPFTASSALPPRSPHFFGRRRIAEEVVRNIGRRHYLILGSRRIGKTSLLNHLYGELADTGRWTPLWLEGQGVAQADSFRFAFGGANRADRLVRPPDTSTLFWLEGLSEQAMQQRRPLVLLINEVDGLVASDSAFFLALRSLAEIGRLRLILVGYAMVGRELDNPHSPFYHLTSGFEGDRAFVLGTLEPDACRDLIARLREHPIYLEWEDPTHEERAVQLLIERSYGVPWVLQSFCHQLLGRAHTEGRGVLRLEDARVVIGGRESLLTHLEETDFHALLGLPQGQKDLARAAVRLLLGIAVLRLYHGPDRKIERPDLRTLDPAEVSFGVAELARWSHEFAVNGPVNEAERTRLLVWHRRFPFRDLLRGLCLTLLLRPAGPDRFCFQHHIYPLELRTMEGPGASLQGRVIERLWELLTHLGFH